MKLDALEEIVKARKPKGLDNWKKLEHLSSKLQGKQASAITFTTCYPGQEGAKKYLGSSSGNLHFLLGYVSPGFHLAPYHWQVVDPNLTDEEAAKKPHPANPRYWQESGLEIEDEGDLDLGKPHPSASKTKRGKARSAAKKTGAIQVQSGYGKYVAVPNEGKVWSLTNGHVYNWAIVRESYLASTNPELTHEMDVPYEEDAEEVEKSTLSSLSEPVGLFDEAVYPFVKTRFPKPGSVIALRKSYAVVKPDRLEFFDVQGRPAQVVVFDRIYNHFDLKKGGDIHPSILSNFAKKYLHVSEEELSQFVHSHEDVPLFSRGGPTPGYENMPYAENLQRSLTVDGDTVRVLPLPKE